MYDPITTPFRRNRSANAAATSWPKPISILALPVIHLAKPRIPIMLASVTTNGWIPNSATTAPFSAPTAVEIASAARMAIRICCVYPSPAPTRVSVIATTEVESARILPTLRSIPAVRMTKVMANAMMPITEIWRRMSVRLPSWRKIRDPSAAVGLSAIARIRMPPSPATLCRFFTAHPSPRPP